MKPPLPPPPPTLWAKIPVEFAFCVVMLPALSTSTAPALLPLPPLPPMLRAADAPPFCRLKSPLNPPLPPQPPIDCARMPSDASPDVEMSPVLPTWTLPAVALLPPPPPMARPALQRFLRRGQRGGNGEAAVAATAAERLRENAVRLIEERDDCSELIYAHIAASAAAAAGAGERHAQRAVLRGVGRQREPAVAAAAADRLRRDAVRLHAPSLDVVVARDADRAGRAAAAARAADRDAERRAARCEICPKSEAAVAAAAADRLRQDAVGIVCGRHKRDVADRRGRVERDAVAVDGDRARRPAAAAAAADARAQRGGAQTEGA